MKAATKIVKRAREIRIILNLRQRIALQRKSLRVKVLRVKVLRVKVLRVKVLRALMRR